MELQAREEEIRFLKMEVSTMFSKVQNYLLLETVVPPIAELKDHCDLVLSTSPYVRNRPTESKLAKLLELTTVNFHSYPEIDGAVLFCLWSLAFLNSVQHLLFSNFLSLSYLSRHTSYQDIINILVISTSLSST